MLDAFKTRENSTDDPDFEDVTAECLARGEAGIAISGVTIPRRPRVARPRR